MKKKVTAAILSAAILASGVLVFTACSKNEVNKSSAAAAATNVSASAEITAADKEMTPDRAIEIAVADAGVARDKAVFEEVPQLDKDDAVPHFDVEFTADGVEYDYEIGLDGTILKAEKEKDDDEKEQSAPGAEKKADSDTREVTPDTSKAGYISVEEAKAAALKHAGLDANEVIFEEATFDGSDRIAHYDIEFRKGNTEYDYEINAKTGAVMDSEKDYDKPDSTRNADTSAFIGEEKAKEIALKDAGFAAGAVTELKCELDDDDLIAHYSVEFKNGGFEFEYEINAKSGKIMGFEKDIDR